MQFSVVSFLERILMASGAVVGVLIVFVAFLYVSSGANMRSLRKRKATMRRSSSASQSTELSYESPSLEGIAVDTEVKAKRLREEIDRMHSQLNVRAGAFLAINGTVIGILAGFNPTPIVTVVLTLAVMLVNFIGVLSNHQYAVDLKVLRRTHDEAVPNDPVVRALEAVKSRRLVLSPTIAFALYLPLIVFFSWYAFLVLVWPL